MARVEDVGREMAVLWPKIMRGVRMPSVFRLKLSSAQMLILATLRELGECKVSTLAKEKGVALPTITGLLDRLVKAGFVKRRRDEADRRTVLVSLSKKGEQTFEQIRAVVRKHWAGVASQLSDSERAELVRVFRRLSQVLTKAPQE